MFRAGETIGEYVLLAHLGEGATGTVWRADRTDTGKIAALKLSRPDRVPPGGRGPAFEQLTRALTQVGRLDHPNLAPIYGTVRRSEDGVFGLATEYLRGPSLARSNFGEGPRGLSDLLEYVKVLAATLEFLHRRGLVHGNVKPENVIVLKSADGTKVKLLDLCWSLAGLSRRTEASKIYVAPEIRAGEAATAASDQWSLASLIAIRHPPATLPPSIGEVMRRARADEPGRRFPSVQAFAEALDKARREPDARPVSFGAINPSQDRHLEASAAPAVGPNDPTQKLSPPRSMSRSRIALIVGVVLGVAAWAVLSLAGSV